MLLRVNRDYFPKQDSLVCVCNGTSVGTAVAEWLRCCATNRKVAGSIPVGVIGIFN